MCSNTDNKNQKLFTVVRHGDICALQDFLDKEYKNEPWKREIHAKSGDSILHVATREGHLGIVQWLVNDKNLDAAIANSDGKQALHYAAQFGQYDCLCFLLQKVVSVDCLKRADWTPLMLACTKTNLEVVRCLVDKGADIMLRNKDGWNSFHIACRAGDLSIVNYLLSCNSGLWNVSSKNGRTPLHTAALNGHTAVVSTLMQHCHYPVDPVDSCGVTPLMDALRSSHVDTADILLKHQAGIINEDNMGHSSLHLAAQAGAVTSISWICERGVNINIQSSHTGISPLHLAAKEGQVMMIEELCRLKANVNIQDHRGRTALHQACGGQHLKCVQVLCQYGAKDVCDHSSHTAASFTKKQEILDLLGTVQV